MKGALKNHINSVHIKNIEKCTHCEAQFGTKNSLQNHIIKIHSDVVKLFSCDKCNIDITSQIHHTCAHIMGVFISCLLSEI